MSTRWQAAALVAGVVAGMTVVGATQAAAQLQTPRTAWGDPDLQGVWDFSTITPLERPEHQADQEFLTEEEAASLEQDAVDRDARLLHAPRRRAVAGESVGAYNNFWMDRGRTTVVSRRTSQIVAPPDGRLPPLTPTAQDRTDRRRAYIAENPAASWLDLSVSDRCLMGFNAGPPVSPGFYNQNLQVFQTPDHVVLLTEMVHTVRVVPIAGQAKLAPSIRQWSGDSRGHWEGETLVITTSNFNGRSAWDRCPVFRSVSPTDSLTLTERITRLGADTLDYAYTVSDPRTWTSPWSASLSFRRTEAPIFEYACHEGNRAITNILAGARAGERRESRGPNDTGGR